MPCQVAAFENFFIQTLPLLVFVYCRNIGSCCPEIFKMLFSARSALFHLCKNPEIFIIITVFMPCQVAAVENFFIQTLPFPLLVFVCCFNFTRSIESCCPETFKMTFSAHSTLFHLSFKLLKVTAFK